MDRSGNTTPIPELPKELSVDYFDSFKTVNVEDLPNAYHREATDRIFVTRDTNMKSIKYVGFDMDYTLAVYNSPLFEEITYDLSVLQLIKMGYPEDIKNMKYDPKFPIRGLFVDTTLGNFLKVDSFRYIHSVIHGRTPLTVEQRAKAYPSVQVHPEEINKRFFMMNTLFNLVDACLYSDLIVYFENLAQEGHSGVEEHKIISDKADISYTNLFNDIRTAVDLIHFDGSLKNKTIEMLDQLVIKSPRLSVLLDRLQQNGTKTFLLTNSPFDYTDKLMSYLLDGYNDQYSSWRDYFDYIIVSAAKPAFFSGGTTLREVDTETNTLKMTRITKFEKGRIYNGGSMKTFSELSGSSGSDVLYVGDHIFSDIIVSKKMHRWRNLLVIRELDVEISVQDREDTNEIRMELEKMNYIFRELYRGVDSSCTQLPDITLLRKRIKKTIRDLDSKYNKFFGSLFRCGSKNSFFAMQVMRYADLYTTDFLNLLNYPFSYYFSSNPASLPHEKHTEIPLIA